MKVTYGAIVQRASGKFGGTVHSNWKGVDIVRRFAKPSNPNTTGQQDVRLAFSNLTTSFLLQTGDLRAAWDSYATGKALINRNAWIGKNVPLIQGLANIDALVPTPGDSSTLPPSAATFTPAAGQITVAVTEPAIPSGWSIFGAVASVCQNWDPAAGPITPSEARWFEDSDVTSPYSIVITGLPSGTYFGAAFLIWLAPDGTSRYSASLTDPSSIVP
jgi:hypothetical protein